MRGRAAARCGLVFAVFAAWAAMMGLRPVQLAAAPAAGCRSEPVRADTGARRARFVSWLRRQKLQEREPGSQEPDPGSFEGYRVYVVDIDNDGMDEYVLTDEDVPSANPNGFIRDMLLQVYRPTAEGWSKMATPYDPIIETYIDPVSLQPSPLLVRFCGKTYLNDDGEAAQKDFRQTLIWQNGETEPVCNAAWIAVQRRYFRYIFDHKLYHDAQTFLAGVLRSCDKGADASSWMWMHSDLALTAYRQGRMRTCLAHVDAARARLRQAGGGEVLRRALGANAALCSAVLARPAAPYDFSWLRELRDHPTTPIVFDPRFAGLLVAIAPDVMTEEHDEALPDVLRMALWVPENPEFTGDRYVVLSGWEPHDPGNAGLVWIDFATHRSLARLRQYGKDGKPTLASTTLDLESVPPEAWRQLDLESGQEASYIGPDGRWREIQVPAAAGDPP
jgi:hypothetical protein